MVFPQCRMVGAGLPSLKCLFVLYIWKNWPFYRACMVCFRCLSRFAYSRIEILHAYDGYYFRLYYIFSCSYSFCTLLETTQRRQFFKQRNPLWLSSTTPNYFSTLLSLSFFFSLLLFLLIMAISNTTTLCWGLHFFL